MNLFELIPDNDQKWSVKNNMIYYHHYCDIALVQKKDSTLWIILDQRATKRVLKLIRHFNKLGLEFYLSSKALNSNQDLTTEESKSEIIRNYLFALRSPNFFDGIVKIDFDFLQNLTSYIIKYDCWDLFKEEFEVAKKKANEKYWDYYSNTQTYDLKRNDIREYISGLERDIKINLFL